MTGDQGDEEYERTLEALNRGAPLPERKPERAPVGVPIVMGIVLGLLWQGFWTAFPQWTMPINGLAVYVAYRLIKWAT